MESHPQGYAQEFPVARALACRGELQFAVAVYVKDLTISPGRQAGNAAAQPYLIEKPCREYDGTTLARRKEMSIPVMLADALRHHQAGRLTEAEPIYRRILAIDAHHSDSLHLLGVIACQCGRYDIGASLIGQAIRRCSGNAVYLHNMANALKALGRVDDAITYYERTLALNPVCADAHNNLGSALSAQGKFDAAIAHYSRALALDPRHADAHNNLGSALLAQSKLADAMAHFGHALAANPNHAEAHNNLANVFVAQGRIDDALPHYQRALLLKPDYADAHANLSSALLAKGKLDEAAIHCIRVLTLNPHHAEAHNNLGYIFTAQGKFDDAIAHYGRAIAIRPDYAETLHNRAEIKTFQPGDADLAALEALAGRPDLTEGQALHIHFTLAKALEDTGDYSRAFQHLRQGNALKRRQIAYDEAAVAAYFERIAAVFDSSLFDRFEGEGDPSCVPIFVLGMPRSGSTLVEQILASHPRIHAAGELTDLDQAAGRAFNISGLDGNALRRLAQSYLARLPAVDGGKVRIVDKLPGNFLNIGLIRLILPNARIIHTMRDPMDTCVSCYSKLFTLGADFSYDLGELGRYYRCYSALMTHWRSVLPPGTMLDLEGQARRLIDYCGLPWDDRCLSFHRTSRPVQTASAVQVRKPLFRSSLQRWRKYETYLAPLLREL
jgi:tetratricopeptide (TPR) repeat protein